MYIFLVLGVVMIGLAVLALLNLMGARRFRTIERLSTIPEYGFAARTTIDVVIDTQPRRYPLTNLVTKLGDLLAQRLGALGEEEMQEHLLAAGMYGTSPRTLLGMRVLAATMLPILVLMVAGLNRPVDFLMIAVAAFAGWVLPFTVVKRRSKARVTDIDRRLPDLIDLLCVMIEAGLSFPQSMRLAADQFEGPLSDELRLTLQEQTMGLGIDQALGNLADRTNTPAVRSFVRAMSQGERMGISVGQIMRNLADEMRARRKSSAEEQAQKAPVLMLFPLVFLIFPALLIILMTPAIINLMHNFKGV